MVCRLARLFTKPAFYEPLVALEDPLSGLHANTHLAQVCYTPHQVDALTLIPDRLNNSSYYAVPLPRIMPCTLACLHVVLQCMYTWSFNGINVFAKS